LAVLPCQPRARAQLWLRLLSSSDPPSVSPSVPSSDPGGIGISGSAVLGLVAGEPLTPARRNHHRHAGAELLADPVVFIAVAAVRHQRRRHRATCRAKDHSGHCDCRDRAHPEHAVAPAGLGLRRRRRRSVKRAGRGIRLDRVVVVVFAHAATLTPDPVTHLCGSHGIAMTGHLTSAHAVHSRLIGNPARL